MNPTTPPVRRSGISLRFLTRLAGCLAAAYAVLVLVLLMLEDRFLFHPVRASQHWVEPPAGFDVLDVELQSANGTLIDARWFPLAEAQGAVLICHSRAGNLSLELGQRDLLGWQGELGCSVFIFDYPGYGRSAGRPSEAGCYAAAKAAYDWLTQVQKVPAQRILIYGRSLGTAVAVDLASQRPHRALVLVAPFTSLPDVALGQIPFVPARQLMHNRFPSVAKIGHCTQPVFMVHGTRDHQVPFALGERLFAAANEPKRLMSIAGAQHGDCITPGFFPALRLFLAEVESNKTSATLL
jgi:fermentation-respiration switch protein FrsA (DUF1100 family)